MEVLQLSTQPDDEEDSEPELVEEMLMAVSVASNVTVLKAPNPRRQTIRFRGLIGKQEILISLDSGSVGTFIRDQVVKDCALATAPCD